MVGTFCDEKAIAQKTTYLMPPFGVTTVDESFKNYMNKCQE